MITSEVSVAHPAKKNKIEKIKNLTERAKKKLVD
jgi:hypothetical protein